MSLIFLFLLPGSPCFVLLQQGPCGKLMSVSFFVFLMLVGLALSGLYVLDDAVF